MRTIAPLPLFALRALQRHAARQAAQAELAGGAWQHSGLVFTNSFGGALEPRNLNRHFAGLLRRANLPHMRVHDLRHSCATLLLLQGVELKVVQEILGHSSIRVTADMYAHVLPQLRAEAAQAMDDLFDHTTGPGDRPILKDLVQGRNNRMKLSGADYAIGWLVMFDKVRPDPGILHATVSNRFVQRGQS